MRRRTILWLAGGVAILAGVLPPAAALWLSHDRAIEAETRHLHDYADWTLKRGGLVMNEAKAVLTQINGEGLQGCTNIHIARMRQLTMASRAVDEVGYFSNGRLLCTSWGVLAQPPGQGAPDAATPDGFGLSFHVKPVVSRGVDTVAVNSGSHNVLVSTDRLADVLTDRKMTVGLATSEGQVLAVNGAADPALVAEVVKHAGVGGTEKALFATSQAAGLVAFAISDRALMKDRYARELLALIPLGLLVSALMVGLILLLSRQRLSPHKELAIAIRQREFIAHYQPIIELASGLCVGAEALIRWRRPDGVWIPPDQFIPLAEESGLIEPLTDLLIDRVVHDMARMLIADPSVHVAINIAPCDMESGRFLPVLAAALQRSGICPTQIWLEATERGFMQADAARATMARARAAGHMVAIDDFGTGYSSLSLLERLPLDALKIDKAFIDAIGRDSAASIVTPHIIEIAHGLHFKVVAEGIETPEQEAYARAAGVEFAQGWLYAKALPAEAFTAYCQRRNAGQLAAVMKVGA